MANSMTSKQDLIDYWKNTRLITDEKLLEAFKKVPREEFVPSAFRQDAYGDYPLPIGADQTISQPSTVMIMIQALELKKTDKVLEIGAGSGYNAAIMAKLCKKVISTEIVKELAEMAKRNIKKVGIKNMEVVHWDGSQGYPKEAPYDKIILTAGCKSIPPPLVEQLKENGIILAPVGWQYSLKMVKGRKVHGKLESESLGDFAFVPLQGKYG